MLGLFSKQSNTGYAAVVPAEAGLCVASIAGNGKQPRLETCDFRPWPEGGDKEKLLADAVRRHRLQKRACTTVMALDDYTVLSVEAPDVPPDELRAAIRWQIKDLIDFHIDDAVVDIFDAPPSGAHGRQNTLYVVVSRLSRVRERVDQLQDAEANLTTIDIPELVLRNITARLPEDETGVAFIYLTRERGLLIITRQSTLYFARTLGMGYAALAAGDHAQYDQLVLEVQRSLDYYDRYFVQPPVAGLVLAPCEAPLDGLEDYLHESLGLAVRSLDLQEIVACDHGMDSATQARCLPAIGAALRQESAVL